MQLGKTFFLSCSFTCHFTVANLVTIKCDCGITIYCEGNNGLICENEWRMMHQFLKISVTRMFLEGPIGFH